MSDVTREEFESLKERVDELETLDPLPKRVPTGLDRFEKRVVEQLETGDVCGLARFKTLFNAAGVHQPNTVKRRTQTITAKECFQQVGAQAWEYVGVDNE